MTENSSQAELLAAAAESYLDECVYAYGIEIDWRDLDERTLALVEALADRLAAAKNLPPRCALLQATTLLQAALEGE